MAGFEFKWDESENLGKEVLFKIVQGVMQYSGLTVSQQYLEEKFGIKFEHNAAPPTDEPGKRQGLPVFPVRQAQPQSSEE